MRIEGVEADQRAVAHLGGHGEWSGHVEVVASAGMNPLLDASDRPELVSSGGERRRIAAQLASCPRNVGQYVEARTT